MGTRQLRPVCSLGMFDLLKGIAIILVIFSHTLSFIPMPEFSSTLIRIVTLGNCLEYGFIVAAGFGIRKRPAKKCALQLKKMFLIPYVYTALATSLLLLINQYLLYSDFALSVRAGAYSLLGYILAHHPEQYFGKFPIGNIGPAWFLVSLAGGLFILNLILYYSLGWKRNLLVFLAILIGYFGNSFSSAYKISIPCCLFYMFVFVPGLYIGYLARENNLLEKKLSPAALTLICLALAAFAWKSEVPFLFFGGNPLGVFTPFAAATVSFGFVYLLTHINRRKNLIVNSLEAVGNNTVTILCLHTVEYVAVPWHRFSESLPNASDKHIFFLIFFLRLAFIALGLLVVKSFQTWGGFSRLKKLFFRKKAV